MSEDGTSNKHVAYDSHHINLKVPSYTNDGAKPAHENCLLGITSSPDQTAEGQAEDTVEKLGDALEKCITKALLQNASSNVCIL